MSTTRDFNYLLGHRVSGGEPGFLRPFSFVFQPEDRFSSSQYLIGDHQLVLLGSALGARIREEESRHPATVLASLGGPPKLAPKGVRSSRHQYSFVQFPERFGFSALFTSRDYLPVLVDIDETTDGSSDTDEVAFERSAQGMLSARARLLPSLSYRFSTGATGLIVEIRRTGILTETPVPNARVSAYMGGDVITVATDPLALDATKFKYVARTHYRGRAVLFCNHVTQDGIKAINGVEAESVIALDPVVLHVEKAAPDSIDEYLLVEITSGRIAESSHTF